MEVAGIEFPIYGEAGFTVEDDSFDHEFGTQRDSHIELTELETVHLDCDLRDYIVAALNSIGATKHNRRFIKNVRRIEKQVLQNLKNLDLQSGFTASEKEQAIVTAYEQD